MPGHATWPALLLFSVAATGASPVWLPGSCSLGLEKQQHSRIDCILGFHTPAKMVWAAELSCPVMSTRSYKMHIKCGTTAAFCMPFALPR